MREPIAEQARDTREQPHERPGVRVRRWTL